MKRNKQRGITLVALVVTIIVILIISGVAISLITGENGLFSKANSSATKYNEKALSEGTRINTLLSYLDSNYTSTPSDEPVAPVVNVPELQTTDLNITIDPDTNINP